MPVLEPTVLLLLTNGSRNQVLQRTVASAEQAVVPMVSSRVVAVDSADPAVIAEVRDICAGWEVELIPQPRLPWELVYVGKRKGLFRVRRQGYSTAVRGAIQIALARGMPWIFWLEDDFTFHRRVPLEEMQETLRRHPHVAQMALVRQPWYDFEHAAGGVTKVAADEYVDRGGWLEHRRFFTMNPMLVPRHVLAERTWPRPPLSEFRFGSLLLANPTTTLGYWGGQDDPPAVEHIGEQRAGHGY